MRYRFLQHHEGWFGVAALCRVMQVSRSGYYGRRGRPETARRRENGTRVRPVRRFRATTDSAHKLPVAENLFHGTSRPKKLTGGGLRT